MASKHNDRGESRLESMASIVEETFSFSSRHLSVVVFLFRERKTFSFFFFLDIVQTFLVFFFFLISLPRMSYKRPRNVVCECFVCASLHLSSCGDIKFFNYFLVCHSAYIHSGAHKIK